MSMKNIVASALAACLVVSSGCAQMPAVTTKLTRASTSQSGFELAPALRPLKKISPYYTGPLHLTIDPTIATKQSHFTTKAVGAGFRITSDSTGDGGTAADGHQAQRHTPWVLRHPADQVQAAGGQWDYFDPNNLSSLGGTHVDPKLGETPVGNLSVGVCGFGVGTDPVTSAPQVSGSFVVKPTSPSAVSQIVQLTGGSSADVGQGYYRIDFDPRKVDLTSLPDSLRAISQYMDQPITGAQFSSVDLALTYAAAFSVFANHHDLFESMFVSTIGVGSGVIASGAEPMDTKENDSYTGTQSNYVHLINHRAREAWQYGLGSGGAVAWLDRNYFDLTRHADLLQTDAAQKGRVFRSNLPPGGALIQWGSVDGIRNVATGLDDPTNEHGTACVLAGFARMNNSAGGIGIAPNASVVPLSVGQDTDAINAIHYAVDVLHVDVIGTSQVFADDLNRLPTYVDGIVNAIAYAASKGVPFVASAGNDCVNAATCQWTGVAPDTIVVGGVEPDSPTVPTANWKFWLHPPSTSFPPLTANDLGTNYGDRVDVWATPIIYVDSAGDVYSNANHARYTGAPVRVEGTSFASPQVCATIALMKAAARRLGVSQANDLSPARYKQLLKDNSFKRSMGYQPYTNLVYGPSGNIVSWNQSVYYSTIANILNAEGAVTGAIQALGGSPNQLAATALGGVMTSVSRLTDSFGDIYANRSDLIYDGAIIPQGLPLVIDDALFRASLSSFSVGGYTYENVVGWPVSSGSKQFREVYGVTPQPFPAPMIYDMNGPQLQLPGSLTATFNGQYLVPPVSLSLQNANGSPVAGPITGVNLNGALSHVEFPVPGTLAAGSYRAVLTCPNGSITTTVTLRAPAPTPTPTPTPTSPPAGGQTTWKARIFNVDDAAEIRVNYVTVNGHAVNGCYADVGYGNQLFLDVTPYVQYGNNLIDFQTWNQTSGYTWGFELREYNPDPNTSFYQTNASDFPYPNPAAPPTVTDASGTYRVWYYDVQGITGQCGARNNDQSGGTPAVSVFLKTVNFVSTIHNFGNVGPLCPVTSPWAMPAPTPPPTCS